MKEQSKYSYEEIEIAKKILLERMMQSKFNNEKRMRRLSDEELQEIIDSNDG